MKTLQWMGVPRLLIVIAFVLLGGLPSAAQSPAGPFEVARMVVCAGVQDRTPIDVRDVFPADMEKIFCFLEARDIAQTTEVQMVWYHEETELASVPLTIGQGPRWRTYASKQTMGRKGNWKVYLLDDAGNTLASVQFVIE